ncbi:MAG: hypothetical protein ACRD8Z_16095 [Nitrososphaeraceae archaeon]
MIDNDIDMKNAIIFSGFAVASLVAAMVISPIAVSALADFLNLDQVLVRKNPSGLDAIFKTNGVIPTNGNGVPSAFGYGILTEGGNGIIVSTTHKGVLDSETQGDDGFNPIFHNHFITLKPTTGLGCPTDADAAVAKITFQSPGQVSIQSAEALQARIPNSFTGTDSFTNQPLTLSPGNNVLQAISFSLEAVGVGPGDTTPSAVCVVPEDSVVRGTGLLVQPR